MSKKDESSRAASIHCTTEREALEYMQSFTDLRKLVKERTGHDIEAFNQNELARARVYQKKFKRTRTSANSSSPNWKAFLQENRRFKNANNWKPRKISGLTHNVILPFIDACRKINCEPGARTFKEFAPKFGVEVHNRIRKPHIIWNGQKYNWSNILDLIKKFKRQTLG